MLRNNKRERSNRLIIVFTDLVRVEFDGTPDGFQFVDEWC